MDIVFSNRRLQKELSEAKVMQTVHGLKRTKRLKVVMASLRSVPNMGVLAPPYSPPHRCHELANDLKGKLSLDLDGPYRLIIEPLNRPLPKRAEGGLDWHRVTVIKIIAVENTHG